MSEIEPSRRDMLALGAALPAALVLSGTASAQTAQTSTLLPGAGRVALVTGSSRGIGAATARRLAKDGYSVMVNYLSNHDLAVAVVADITTAGGSAELQQADVADPAAVARLFDATEAAFGGIDVVVNNAGIMHVGPFGLFTDDLFDRMIATNVKGSFNVLREAARRTRDGGRILSLSSSITKTPPPATGPYTASKAAQESFSAVLAKELAGRNISVNAISPGAVDTDLLRQHGEDALRGIPEATPHGRIGLPEDIAEVIALLCSDGGFWVNGQNVPANGGLG